MTYRGATLTWRGRELSKYVEGNKQISYSYDVDGMRYQKIVKTSGVETSRYDYVYSDGKLILLTHTANGLANTARFIYDSFGEPRGFILNNSASYLYLKNGQGDITAIVDENGEILVRYTYNAWGAVEFIVPFGIDPAVTTVLATVSPFTYRGYCYDFDMGMYYLQSRYYDPEICRFINADSTDYLGATGTLLSYNLFAYCENDPVDYVDPMGNKTYKVFSVNSSYSQIANYARALCDASDYPYYTNKTITKRAIGFDGRLITYSYKEYRHYMTTLYISQNKNMAKVTYIPHIGINMRIVNTLMYKTPYEWELYVIARHKTKLAAFKEDILNELGISNTQYTIFMQILSDVTMGTKIGNIVFWYSVIDLASDLISAYRDKLDKYILSCIKGKKDDQYIMISWSAIYQNWRFTNSGFKWVTTTTKSIYQFF